MDFRFYTRGAQRITVHVKHLLMTVDEQNKRCTESVQNVLCMCTTKVLLKRYKTQYKKLNSYPTRTTDLLTRGGDFESEEI